MPKPTVKYMGIDQYGNYYRGLVHPRRDLLERLGRQHAEKMYVDGPDGEAVHVGYVIAGCWIRVLEVRPWHGPTR